ncbi:hypothetical protein ALC57_05223 [Trachymyrmex cornetzi]|uniref:Uncharacterized protein n=1 Tax=Trachymyrmex cornetzi TaxID=471704 RepID=A0A151JB52_9HYME|nr:hypothetical protein ALC57_05223 [Trachymyrmex cornetzi]
MNRSQLDKMTIDQLQVVAQGYNLPLCEDSKKLIDSIMTYLERKPQATQGIITGSPSNGTLPGPSSAKQQSSGVTTIQTWQVSSDVASLIATVVNPMHQDILEGQKRQQELLSKMLELLSNHHGTLANESSEGQPMQPMQEAVSPDGRGIPPSSQRTTLGTITSAHAVTLLATQIPTFGGSDSENVQLWVQRVEQVARIHDVQSDVTLLAASSRLTKLAKRWYDIGSGSMLESWSGFKEAILKRFTRKILYHVAMQKIEVRKWNSFKETFLEYAMDKLTLMHDLNLSPYSIIHLLISGINSRSLRETAAALDLKSVDSFLDSMHKITSVTLEPEKRLTTDSKAAKVKKPTYRRGGKPAHPVSTSQKDKPNTCGFCRIPGHTFENCYKRRRQERLQTTAKASPTTPSTTSSTTTVSAVETVRDDQTIAHVQPKSKNLYINDLALEVTAFNKVICKMSALLDTSSPISFVKPIKNSPSKIFFGYDRRNHSDKSLVDLVNDLAGIDLDVQKQRDVDRNIAAEATQQLWEYNKQYYDKRHIAPTKYNKGDYVMIRKLQSKPGESAKLNPPYKGPYMIDDVLKNNRYVVTDVPGFNRTQRPYKSILSSDKIKPWIRPIIGSDVITQ